MRGLRLHLHGGDRVSSDVQTTYLGWERLTHARICKKPSWEVDVRTDDETRYRGRYGEPRPAHKCDDEDCGHGNSFAQITVRVVCRSCGIAEVITGEHNDDTGRSTTRISTLGYGMAPRKVAGLFLWPGQPWLALGRAATGEPHDFLVTATRPAGDLVTAADVVGQITQSRGQRGGVVWNALAVADPAGPYGTYRVREGLVAFRFCQEGTLRSIAAAAKWIAQQQANGGEG